MNGFSQACQPNNWFPQDVLFGNARFRPSNLGTNGPNSQLSIHFPVYAYNFTLDGGRFDRTARIVTLTAVDSGGWTYGQTRVRVTTQVPNNNNLSETSPQIRLVGEIRNFEDITGCSVSFEAILMRGR